MKLTPLELQDIIGFKEGSSTKSKVFERNGGTGLICKHSIGTGTDGSKSIENEEESKADENFGELISFFEFILIWVTEKTVFFPFCFLGVNMNMIMIIK